jgi:hypothetical protein
MSDQIQKIFGSRENAVAFMDEMITTLEGYMKDIKKKGIQTDMRKQIYLSMEEEKKRLQSSIKILNLLIKADGVRNDPPALKAVRAEMKKEIA